jgi:hypothetical protein
LFENGIYCYKCFKFQHHYINQYEPEEGTELILTLEHKHYRLQYKPTGNTYSLIPQEELEKWWKKKAEIEAYVASLR